MKIPPNFSCSFFYDTRFESCPIKQQIFTYLQQIHPRKTTKTPFFYSQETLKALNDFLAGELAASIIFSKFEKNGHSAKLAKEAIDAIAKTSLAIIQAKSQESLTSDARPFLNDIYKNLHVIYIAMEGS